MPENRQYDADEIAVMVDGERVADLDAVGFDDSKDHERNKTVGEDGDVLVIASGEYEGTVAVKATSSAIETLDELYRNDEYFTLLITYPETEARSESQFIDAWFNSFGPSDDYEKDSMPMYEGEWGCMDVEHRY